MALHTAHTRTCRIGDLPARQKRTRVGGAACPWPYKLFYRSDRRPWTAAGGIYERGSALCLCARIMFTRENFEGGGIPGGSGAFCSAKTAEIISRQEAAWGLRALQMRQVDTAHVGQCMLSAAGPNSTIAPYLRDRKVKMVLKAKFLGAAAVESTRSLLRIARSRPRAASWR